MGKRHASLVIQRRNGLKNEEEETKEEEENTVMVVYAINSITTAAIMKSISLI